MSKSIIDLAADLINIPSQGGIDSIEETLNYIYNWFLENSIQPQYLYDEQKRKVAVLYELKGKKSGEHYCFNACADTAPFGDLKKWDFNPTTAVVKNGYLYGRGSSDSKIGISIFAHIAKELLLSINDLSGQVDFLFDADEHTGIFSGVSSYVNHLDGKSINGVYIGYPGNDEIKIGARGFYRLKVTFNGEMAHTGSKNTVRNNAIVKAANFVSNIEKLKLLVEEDRFFSFGPKISITRIEGGDNFSVTPSNCDVYLDVRLTPNYGLQEAYKSINQMTNEIDQSFEKKYDTIITDCGFSAPYKLDEELDFISVLKKNAEIILSKTIPCSVCGPSNVGNFLFDNDIKATCGFGVVFDGMHSINERIRIDSINDIYKIYYQTIRELL